MDRQLVLARSQTFLENYRKLEYRQHRIEEFTFAEVQTIVLIAHHSQLTLADIARERGISRSAVTQLIKKLEKKNCIRRVSVDHKRFNFELLTEGQKVYQEHQRQHAYMNKKLVSIMEQYPDEFFQKMFQLMGAVETLWDSLPWEQEEL